jgi:uncharacterized YigZ family protein
MSNSDDTYKTLKAPSQGLYKDKGSKFISFAYPVYSEEDIKEQLSFIKKEYFDARHHCYAYALGLNREHYRAFDDGEPSGTAGKPIYGQIQSFGITNILIIVVRYFGGTLLGTGGLITAYKSASEDALHNAEFVEKTVNSIYSISFDYAAMNGIMKILKDEGIEQFNQNFGLNCSLQISARNSKVEQLLEKLSKIETVKHEFDFMK